MPLPADIVEAEPPIAEADSQQFKVHLLFAGKKQAEFVFTPLEGEDCMIDLNPEAVRAALVEYDAAKARHNATHKHIEVARILPTDLQRRN